jgi:hypothetical protein
LLHRCWIPSAQKRSGQLHAGVAAEPATRLRSAAGVGSKGTQPRPGNHASTHEWASFCVTARYPADPCHSPPRKPVTLRAGIPTIRSSSTMVVEKYSQCPSRRSKRKWSIEVSLAVAGRSSV